MALLPEEHLRVIVMDVRNRVLEIVDVYKGSVNSSQIRVGELFQVVIKLKASAIIVAHNHPSGDPTANGLVVTGANEETGESRTTFDAVPMPFKLGLNGIFLAQGLEAIGVGNQVHLHLNSANAPVMLTNGSREYIYISAGLRSGLITL